MPVDQESIRSPFAKLLGILRRSGDLKPESVHHFRTYSRRVEAILFELVPDLDRNQKKLLKMLKRYRRKAGKVRDLDIQIEALRGMRISQSPARKSHLLRIMSEERVRRQRKLEKAFESKSVAELRKRLRRAEKDLAIPGSVEPVEAGLKLFFELGKDGSPLTEKKLHEYRIIGKRARYLAELAGDSPEGRAVVEHLKQMQDSIGEWHDWLVLTQRAESLFKEQDHAPLIVALRNLTRARFRQAVNSLATTQRALHKPVTAAKSVASSPETAVA